MDRNTFLTGFGVCFFLTISLLSNLAVAEMPSLPAFDSDSAYQLLIKQCQFGPRVPGSAAHRQCSEFLISYLKQYATSVKTQPFTIPMPSGAVEMFNIIASYNPMHRRQVLLCAHWDTRPRADMDADPANRGQPIVGANDGASGVAVL